LISIKTSNEIKTMRRGGRILAVTLKELSNIAKPGMKLSKIDKIAHDLITKSGGQPSFLNYNGYPGSMCASINDEVVHGLPRETKLRDGDIFSIDCGVYFEGYHTDSAITIPIGKIGKDAINLISITRNALYKGIDIIRPGIYLGDVSAAIQREVESAGMGVVKDLVGHGIGKELHEEPQIPNFGKRGTGIILREGMTLAIEPMVTLGRPEIKVGKDNWTIFTVDGSLSAHFEHTICVTKEGSEILTK